jgi:hypothetical protein
VKSRCIPEEQAMPYAARVTGFFRHRVLLVIRFGDTLYSSQCLTTTFKVCVSSLLETFNR